MRESPPPRLFDLVAPATAASATRSNTNERLRLRTELSAPLHRARPARADHRVAAVDVRRRSDLPKEAAAHAGALESAEVHAVRHVEDFPARLQPRIPLQLELFEDVEIELRETWPASAVTAARAEPSGCQRRKRLRGVRDRRAGRIRVGEQIVEAVVVDRVGETVSAQRLGVLARLIEGADARREGTPGECREYGADLQRPSADRRARDRVAAADVEVVTDVEVAGSLVVGRIVGVGRLRIRGITIPRIVVGALRQRVVVLRVDPVPRVLAIRQLQAVVPRLAVVGELPDAPILRELRAERSDQIGTCRRRAERRRVDLLAPPQTLAARADVRNRD